jgi:hypothetical protein
MAGTLKVKIHEDIILDNQDYGSKRVLEISSIAQVIKRIVSVPTTETGLLGVGVLISTDLSKSYIAGFVTEVGTRYIRITNLDSSNYITLNLKDEDNGEFAIRVDAGHSFIVPAGNGLANMVDISSSALSVSFEDLVDITAQANSSACNVEVFVASA